MRALPSTSDVVIVGAGPAGLALGCVLAREGVPFLILDRLPEGRNTSRAAVVHARTLEVLEELGVSRKLCSAGLAVPRFTVRDGDHVLLAVRFDQLPSRYPYTLMVPQDVTETVLLDRLRELGGDVCRPCEVADLRRNGDGAALSIVVASGASPRTVQARYVIGADGMHSLVRERSGIGFEGGTYEEAFVLADARMSWPLGAEEVTLFFSPEGLVVVAPLPGGRHRVVAAVDDAPEEPGLDEVQALLDRRGAGAGAARVHEIVWSSRFRVHHRVASRFRANRILLVGDAAHVHSPAGGQGMNIGIQDSLALGHALAAVVRGGAPESRLDDYERSRRPVAERVVTFTDRMTRAATLRGHRARSLRNAAIALVGRIPAVQRRLAVELAELSPR